MAKHYVGLSHTLRTFKDEIPTTGQTLPADTGNAALTFFHRYGEIFVGANSRPPEQIALNVVEFPRFFEETEYLQPPEPTVLHTLKETTPPADIPDAVKLGKWYRLPLDDMPEGNNLFLELVTRDKAISPDEIKKRKKKGKDQGNGLQ